MLDFEAARRNQIMCRTYFEQVEVRHSVQDAFHRLLPGYTIGTWRRGNISVRIKTDNKYNSEFVDRMHWGADLGLRLLVDDSVVAGLAFDVLGESLRVRQIQGVSGCAAELCQLRWSSLLLHTFVEVASKGVWRRLMVVPACEERCYPLGDQPGEEKIRQAMRRHYDETAVALGFAYNPPTRHYIRNLRTDVS